MRLSHALVIASLAVSVAVSAQAPDRTKPPRPGPPPAARAARDPEAPAGERVARLDRRAAQGARRPGQSRGARRRRGRSGRQVRRDEPDDGDARGGRRLAVGAADCRRHRFSGGRSGSRQHVRCVGGTPARAGRAAGRRAADHGRRGAPAHIWTGGARAVAAAAADGAAAGARRPGRPSQRRPSRGSCTARRTATAPRWRGPRRPSRR